MRGYNADVLGEQIKELKKTLSLHGRPGHWTYERRKQALSAASAKAGGGSRTAGIDGSKGSFAQVLVPDDVQIGDVLELRAGDRKIQVTVHEIDGGGARVSRPTTAPASRREDPPLGAAPGGFVMQACGQ